MKTHPCWWLIGVLVMVGLLCSAKVAAAQSQPVRCSDVLEDYKNAVRQDRCRNVAEDTACYGNYLVSCEPPMPSFTKPGKSVALQNLTSLQTSALGNNRGAAILVAKTSRGPVKIYALGNTNVAPGSNTSTYTLYRTNQGDVCEQTPSGVMLQTDKGKKGRLVLNGVTIDLSSTAFVSVEGDLMFDQDPRIERRRGSRNPNAPLCSGFDSECDFANCPVNYRLVWGPYCREDTYSYIKPGLYRVTLFGQGTVMAGATDFGSSNQMFSIMSRNLRLPASYTFCWTGRQPNGTGFETVVLSRSSNARIDHLRLEYLSDDCTVVNRLGSSTPNMMTVTNLEGQVTVSAVGRMYNPRPGEEVRVYFAGGRPVRIDAPVRSTILPRSVLIREIEAKVLPLVNASGYPPIDPYGSSPSEQDGGTYTCSPAYANIASGQCIDLRWDIEGVRAVYLDGAGVTGHETRRVCPPTSRTYELRIVTDQGDRFCRMTVEVSSYLPSSARTLYDFVAEAPNAAWSGSWGWLPWQGGDTDRQGIVRWIWNARLEDGSRPERVLETHPTWEDYGSISGRYPTGNIEIEPGDRFVARVGFLEGAEAGDVTFRVWFVPAIAVLDAPQSPTLVAYTAIRPIQPYLVAEVSDSYDRQLRRIEVDLTEMVDSLSSAYGAFELQVLANETSQQDWAVWVEARLERQ